MLSYSIQEEIDPVQWTVLVGNIGGVWEIILVIWSVLFVAARVEDPNLKARNLVKSARRARERAVRQAARLSSMSLGSSGGGCVSCSPASSSVVVHQPDSKLAPTTSITTALRLSGAQHIASPNSLGVSIEEERKADGKWKLTGGMPNERELDGATIVRQGSAGGDTRLGEQYSSLDYTSSTSRFQVIGGKEAILHGLGAVL